MLKRLGVAIALAAALAAPAVASGDDADAEATANLGTQRAFAELIVDGMDRGRTLAEVDGADVLVLTDDARRAGIVFSPDSERTIAGAAYVSLRALAPGVTFRFDPESITIAVTLDPTSLGTHAIVLSAESPAPLVATRPPSAFTNYEISAQTGASASALLETGLSSHDSLLYSNESYDAGRIVRGSTYFAHDSAARLQRLQIGDATVSGDALLGDVDVLGVGVRRLFEIDPYVFRFPSPSVAGVIASPGTADVYVNGLLERSIPLQPGAFNLNGLSIGTGLNDVTVVVRDAQGNAHTYAQSYFSSDALLRKGLTDYSYGAGFLREDESGNAYGNAALAASYRAGVTDALTLGARGVSTARGSEAEASGDVLVGAAVFHMAEAFADAGALRGAAFDGSFSYTARWSALGAEVTERAPTFTPLTTSSVPVAPERLNVSLTASQHLAPGTTLDYAHLLERFTGGAPQTSDQLGISASLDRDTQLFASAARARSGTATPYAQYSIALSRSLGRRSYAAIEQDAGTAHGGSVTLQSNAPSPNEGFGYMLRYERAPQSSALLALTEHAPAADLNAYLQTGAGANSATLTAGGSVVAVDGHVLPSRPVGDAFALVESGDVAGVPVLVDGQVSGRTDADGLLVVPSLGAFAPNRIDLDVSSLPLGVDLAHDEHWVAPGYRGGSVASFHVERITYVAGRVLLRDAGTVETPGAGLLILQRDAFHASSELDDDGAYYFENLAAGRYRATLAWHALTCTFDFDVPKATSVASNLGVRTCVH